MAEAPSFETHCINVGDLVVIGGVRGRVSEVRLLPNTPSYRKIEYWDCVETVVAQIELGDVHITLKRIPND
jgi:hypothetical protein